MYLSVDPFSQNNIFNRSVDRILHELIFATSISMYFILLLVWHGLYTAFDIDSQDEHNNSDLFAIDGRKEKKKLHSFNWDKLKLKGCFKHYYKFKKAIIFILIIIYPLQITFSYFRGERNVDSFVLNSVLMAIFLLLLSFVVIFIFYTCRLKFTLSKSYETPGKSQSDSINRVLTKSNIKYKN